MASALHPVLAAPSGGLSSGSPGCSRRWWCSRWSTRTSRVGTSAGWQGCWVESASDRCHLWAAQGRPQVLWSLSLCWWAWLGWEPSGCVGSPGTSSDHSGPVEQQHVDKLMIMKATIIGIFFLHNGSHHYVYVKEVTCSDEPTENYHTILQLPSALRSILVPFSSVFRFSSPQLDCFGSLSPLL